MLLKSQLVLEVRAVKGLWSHFLSFGRKVASDRGGPRYKGTTINNPIAGSRTPMRMDSHIRLVRHDSAPSPRIGFRARQRARVVLVHGGKGGLYKGATSRAGGVRVTPRTQQ
jgi:hypothetical protein